MQRRQLIKSLAGAAALNLLPIGRNGWAAETTAAASGANAPRLVVVMLRGAVDGLNVVVPHGDDDYYRARTTLAIAKPGSDDGAIDLDGYFGLHPSLAALAPLWKSKRLAFVHASGSPDPTRSHFDAQDYLESGTPGNKGTHDGWLNRLLAVEPEVQGLSFGPTLPRIFAGREPVASVPLGRLATQPGPIDRPAVAAAFDKLYAGNDALGAVYREGRETRERMLKDLSQPVSNEADVADNGAPPARGFPLDAQQLATLMRNNAQARIAFLALGGWDTHINQGGSRGVLATRLEPLGQGLATLTDQLGPLLDRTVIVVVSEFGRTVMQNGNGGTDHGRGNVMWVLGGPVAGGKVYGEWPTLANGRLIEHRDLAITTDFRSVLATVCERHLGLDAKARTALFPGAPAAPSNLGSLIRA